jgi:hypothetical protein
VDRKFILELLTLKKRQQFYNPPGTCSVLVSQEQRFFIAKSHVSSFPPLGDAGAKKRFSKNIFLTS